MRTIDGHTFDETLLTGSWVIDGGCRGWKLSYYCWFNHRCKTYGIDIEEFSDAPNTNDARFKQAALTNYTGQTECYLFGNGTGNFIKGINGVPGNSEDRPVQTITVPTITLQDIYNEIGTDIDLLKLDIEGAEYAVLENFEPIPRQITVEFHEHVHKHLHDTYFNGIFERLCKDYHCNLYIREWPQYKYMDCLFIRKDLA